MELKSRSTVAGSYGSPWWLDMRAITESLGIRRTPITCGWQSAWEPRLVSVAAGGAFCNVTCARARVGSNGSAARTARPATARAMRERLRTDFSLMLRKLPLTRFTVKIRTPSLLLKLLPGNSAPIFVVGKLRLYGSNAARRESSPAQSPPPFRKEIGRAHV